jgi:hypothetical protein
MHLLGAAECVVTSCVFVIILYIKIKDLPYSDKLSTVHHFGFRDFIEALSGALASLQLAIHFYELLKERSGSIKQCVLTGWCKRHP